MQIKKSKLKIKKNTFFLQILQKKFFRKVLGYLNLLANCTDNLLHGLAVGTSFLTSTRLGKQTISSSSSLFDILWFLYTTGNLKPKLFLVLLKLHLINTIFIKYCCQYNTSLCRGPVFVSVSDALNSFFFFSLHNPLNSVIYDNKKSKNIRDQDKSPQIICQQHYILS